MTALTLRSQTLNDAFYQTIDFRYRVLRPLFDAENYQAAAQAIASGPRPPSIDQTTSRYRLVKMVMAEDADGLDTESWKAYAAGSRDLDYSINTMIEAIKPGDAFGLYELAVTVDELMDEYCRQHMPTVLSGFRKLLVKVMPAVVTRAFDAVVTQAMARVA